MTPYSSVRADSRCDGPSMGVSISTDRVSLVNACGGKSTYPDRVMQNLAHHLRGRMGDRTHAFQVPSV